MVVSWRITVVARCLYSVLEQEHERKTCFTPPRSGCANSRLFPQLTERSLMVQARLMLVHIDVVQFNHTRRCFRHSSPRK
jgi:hypothetical protein